MIYKPFTFNIVDTINQSETHALCRVVKFHIFYPSMTYYIRPIYYYIVLLLFNTIVTGDTGFIYFQKLIYRLQSNGTHTIQIY